MVYSVFPFFKENIALGRSCNQSSTHPALRGSAERAVDGRTTTNFNRMPSTCTHTDSNDQNPSWNVKLNTSVTEKIQHIRLYLRDDPIREYIYICIHSRQFPFSYLKAVTGQMYFPP